MNKFENESNDFLTVPNDIESYFNFLSGESGQVLIKEYKKLGGIYNDEK